MKKTLFFLLGLLVAMMLPGPALRAQTMQVSLTASPLDRAAVQSATIYQAAEGQAYFADSAEVDPSVLPSCVDIRTMSSVALTVAADGFHVAQDVDSGFFARSVIVLTDTNGRHYVLGHNTGAWRAAGFFYGALLFANTSGGIYTERVLADIHILGPAEVAVADNESNYFSSIHTALELTTGTTLTLLKDITVDRPVLITRDVTVQQSGKVIASTCASTDSALVVIEGAEVSWFGYNATADIAGVAGDLFHVMRGVFNLRHFKGAANHVVVNVGDSASATLSGCEISSTLGLPAINMSGSADVTVRNVAVGSAVFVHMDDNAHGTLAIRDSTATATTAAIEADAYFKDGDYWKYSGLTQAATVATDTVFLARSLAAGKTGHIPHGMVVELNGNSIAGTLHIASNEGTVRLQNGAVNTLEGSGAVVINDLDCVDSLGADSLSVVVENGRIRQIVPATGADVLLKGGKYGQDYSDYVAPRHVMRANAEGDAAQFPFRVVEGYEVTFHNWDNRGHDSTAIVCNDDNTVPAPARPAFVGADTIFSSYWIDPAFHTPWNFAEDVLASDTTLYAQWIPINPVVESRYVVAHYQKNLAGTADVLRDIAYGVDTIGQRVVVRSHNTYAGFHCTEDSVVFLSLSPGGTDTAEFHYVRDSFDVTYDLGGGFISLFFDNVQRHVYGDTIDYPDTSSVFRPGHACTGWSPRPTTVPDHDLTVRATYNRRSYPLTWTGFDTIVNYDGTDRGTTVSATYTDDYNNHVQAVLSFTDAENHVSDQAVDAGIYTVTASPADTNYLLGAPWQTTLTVRPVLVSVSGIEVEKVKEFDNNANVTVTNPGTLSVNYDPDHLFVNTTAKYYSAGGDTSYFVGQNKTIKAFVALGGEAADNYRLSPSEMVIATNGQIIEPMTFDNRGGNMGADSVADDKGIEAQASGFCNGESSLIDYGLTSGSADQYKLEFSAAAQAQGFTDVDWTDLPVDGNTIDIAVPAGAASGDYKVWVTLRRNIAGQVFDSPRLGTTFHVNLPKAYVKPIFSDVISIIDTCHCIDHSSVHWYHNDTYVGDGPYYQEAGGLTGTYHATFTINGIQNRTCPQSDFNSYPDEVATVVVSIYPNPTSDIVTVRVENATEPSHTLRVMNLLGMTLLDTSFDGDETEIDFSHYTDGSYTVSVDGTVVRVIKK